MARAAVRQRSFLRPGSLGWLASVCALGWLALAGAAPVEAPASAQAVPGEEKFQVPLRGEQRGQWSHRSDAPVAVAGIGAGAD